MKNINKFVLATAIMFQFSNFCKARPVGDCPNGIIKCNNGNSFEIKFYDDYTKEIEGSCKFYDRDDFKEATKFCKNYNGLNKKSLTNYKGEIIPLN